MLDIMLGVFISVASACMLAVTACLIYFIINKD